MSDSAEKQDATLHITDRQRILAAIRGETPDRLPFVPRLEFWYRAKRRNNTLPPEFRGLSLMEIADRIGVGYYSVLPDLTDCAGGDMVDGALGILRLPVLSYKVTLEGVERRVLSHGRETVVEYLTPVGTIRTATVFTEEMEQAGASAPWITERAIRRPQEIYTAFADRITIWGGIPSILLCPGSASFAELQHYVDKLFDRYRHESHFVLGVSDMVTEDAESERLHYIADRVRSLG